VDTARVFSLEVFGDVWQQALIDRVCDERCEWSESLDEGEENFEKSVQCVLGVVEAELALQTLPVESNVPICCVVDEI
jgi:hypothetical protein